MTQADYSYLRAFLKHNVEGYLFYDLHTMQATSPPPHAPGGGLGYPLLMTTLAGIELLGALLSPNRFNTNSGDVYFRDYWQRFLYAGAMLPEMEIVYNLARHGIAHTFLLKGPVAVVKGQPRYHLKHGSDGTFYIDANQLSSDLIVSYQLRVQPFLSSPTSDVNPELMTLRLGEIDAIYSKRAEGLLKATREQPPMPGAPPGPSGAIGTVGPVPSTVSSTQGLSMTQSKKKP